MQATKTFTDIPPFRQIRIWFRFIKIDTWEYDGTPEYLRVDVNGVLRKSMGLYDHCRHQYTGNQCGSAPDTENREHTEFVTIDITDNTMTSLTVRIYSNLDQAANDESWAFTQFSISTYPCHPTCKTCSTTDSNVCLSCYTSATKQADNTCTCDVSYTTLTSNPCTSSPCTVCLLCLSSINNRLT